VAETGIGDDWSYVKTAQVLASTGHIVYNGWGSPILGWQLLLAAFFIKIFGSSFFVVRSTTWLIATTSCFVTHRAFVRLGVRDWNATIGTLTLMLSPVVLPLSFIFMTDVAGLFCILVCLYACVRALQAGTSRAAIGWICFAALSNALGGTVRQIAWLGVLVMVPSTLWLLRRQRNLLLIGGVACAVSVGFIYAATSWFKHQAYTVPEPLIRGKLLSLDALHIVVDASAHSILDVSLFVLPVLLMFVSAIRPNRRAVAMLSLAVALCLGSGLFLQHHHRLTNWLFPYLGANVTLTGLMDGTLLHGSRPVLLTGNIRLLLTILDFAALIGFVTVLFETPQQDRPQLPDAKPEVSWAEINMLTMPFTVAYSILVLTRTPFQDMFDRYLYAYVFLALLVLMRLYQERVSARLPAASFVLALVFAGYSIAATHDTFAMYRAHLAAIDELRSAGVPATDIDGGFEYNAWTQIEKTGYVNESRIQVPAHLLIVPVTHLPDSCYPFMDTLTPAVEGRYALSYDPAACHGKTAFAPVSYHAWLGPHTVYVYIVDASHH
jgi:hypothetical protein